MSKSDNVASFMIRFTQEIWQDAEGEPHVQWRGHIRHIQSDEAERFTNFTDAVAFIQRQLTELSLRSASAGGIGSQEKVLYQSFKWWEQFALGYTDIMLQTMDQSIRQTESFREHVEAVRDKTMQAWRIPMETNQEHLLDAIVQLQTEIKKLSTKMDKVEERLPQPNNGTEP